MIWAGFMAWSAFEREEQWFLRWPMVAFALTALGIAAHFARIAVRHRVRWGALGFVEGSGFADPPAMGRPNQCPIAGR